MHLNRAIVLTFIVIASAALSSGCASTGIAVREQLGFAKREQLVDRVEEARDEQEEAKVQFATTLDEFKSLTGFDGAELESTYRRLKKELDRSEDAADDVSGRITAVERVGNAMFREWEDELDLYATASLRSASEQQLTETRGTYTDLLNAMKRAESSMAPVLAAFGDQVLFLKHNLNARAIASLDETVVELEDEIGRLIDQMNASIAEADAFIGQLGTG
ncbi:MAG: DUF2959 domain-containing protein [Planctomycetota bacterium]